MHETLDLDVRFHLDTFHRSDNTYTMDGWLFNQVGETIESLIVDNELGDTLAVFKGNNFYSREDVRDYYKNEFSYNSGFYFSFQCDKEFKKLILSIQYSDNDELFRIAEIDNINYKPNTPSIEINNIHPSIIAIDNFYTNPDEVRDYALSLDFQYNKEYHKGKRTKQQTFFNGTKEFFEDVLKKQVTSWESQPHNGVFQYCTAEDQLVYHNDAQTYAAVVFLTPDAPPDCGTSFFKHRENGLRAAPTNEDCARLNKTKDELFWDMFHGNFYDKTPWDLVDVIGNVYNRMAIWDAKLVHAASRYFGENKHDGRLFHMFFFDAK